MFLCATIAIGDGLPNVLTQPIGIQIGFLALALIMIGILAGWRWEFVGGLVSFFGWILFTVIAVRSPKRLTWFVALLAVPAALYVVSALLRRYAGKVQRPAAVMSRKQKSS